MKVRRRMSLIIALFLVLNMVIATQYAITKVVYEYTIVHPCDASIRFIGSDNSTDGVRILRIDGSNTSNIKLKLSFGTVYTTNMQKTFTAAFGIVNEENYSLNITHINVSSNNFTYMKIWLHGDRDANANRTATDPSAVYMWNNDTMVNLSNTTAWTLARGNDNSSDMCYNISNRYQNSTPTVWDEIAHVRYSRNDTNAVSGVSDFVWVQVTIDIPSTADTIGAHTGTIWVYLESEN